MQESRWSLMGVEQRGRVTSLDLLATLLLMQLKIWLAFWSASAHWWLMLSFLSTNTPKCFSTGLLSIPSSPIPYLCLGLPWPMCRTLHLALMIVMRFAQAHFSSLSRSLRMTSFPRSMLTTPHSWVLLANLLRVHSIPLSMSPTKMLNRSVYWSLRNLTHHWSPLGHWPVYCNSLIVTIQPIPYPQNGPSIKSSSHQLRQKDVMWDNVKCFAQVQVGNVSCSSLIHPCCNPSIEGCHICKASFAISEAMLAVTNHLLTLHVP